jgi:hypothetical protein
VCELPSLHHLNREGRDLGPSTRRSPVQTPFFAARPAIARTMLEAIRPYALAKHSFVRLFVEHGVVLSAMSAADAETVLEMPRMQGPIGV